MVKVLFVCLGNICRSPTADAVFRAMLKREGLARQVTVDSAGTGDWNLGRAPDKRAADAAARRGYDLSALRARLVRTEDFEQFDYILAMDEKNLANLRKMADQQHHHKIRMFLEFAPQSGLLAIPDPYCEGDEHFERVLDLVEAAAAGLLEHLKKSVDR